jgi:hypothetical protein
MKRSALLAVFPVAAVLALVACGGGGTTTTTASKSEQATAAACQEFDKWMAQFPLGSTSMADPTKAALLKVAVAEAPSGSSLYQDLSNLESNVLTASPETRAPGSSDQYEDELIVDVAANIQQTDCASVNPGS